jgi:predicted transcriptional regulator
MLGQLEYVQTELAKYSRAQWIAIADESGVPFSTFKKIGYGQTPTPRSDTVDKIAAALRRREEAKAAA